MAVWFTFVGIRELISDATDANAIVALTIYDKGNCSFPPPPSLIHSARCECSEGSLLLSRQSSGWFLDHKTNNVPRALPSCCVLSVVCPLQGFFFLLQHNTHAILDNSLHTLVMTALSRKLCLFYLWMESVRNVFFFYREQIVKWQVKLRRWLGKPSVFDIQTDQLDLTLFTAAGGDVNNVDRGEKKKNLWWHFDIFLPKSETKQSNSSAPTLLFVAAAIRDPSCWSSVFYGLHLQM